MKIDFGTCHIKETPNCKGPWGNTISVKLKDGREIVLDRDQTEYTVNEDGTMTMEWLGVYIWNGENPDYDISEDMMNGAKIISIEIEEDADPDYDLIINHSQVQFLF